MLGEGHATGIPGATSGFVIYTDGKKVLYCSVNAQVAKTILVCAVLLDA